MSEVVAYQNTGNGGRIPVSTAQPLPVTFSGSSSPATVSTGTLTAVASQATNVTIVAANSARKGAIITNTDANALYLKYGATATTASFTVIIQANGYWEMPQPIYTGIIDGIWAADGAGSAYVTEL